MPSTQLPTLLEAVEGMQLPTLAPKRKIGIPGVPYVFSFFYLLDAAPQAPKLGCFAGCLKRFPLLWRSLVRAFSAGRLWSIGVWPGGSLKNLKRFGDYEVG